MTELYWRNWPVSGMPENITGRFGQNYGGYLHRGVDVGVYNVPVYAPAPGLVVPMTNDGSFGIAVCLQHEDSGWFSCYAHLSQMDVAISQWVNAGERLGTTGNTGYSTGPHLHWQVCDSSTFPTDISHSRDPLLVPWAPTEEEEMGMTPAETDWVQSVANKVAVLEALVAGNGIDTDGDGVIDTFGDEAVAWAYARFWGAFALGQKADMRIALHEVSHVDPGTLTPHQRTYAGPPELTDPGVPEAAQAVARPEND